MDQTSLSLRLPVVIQVLHYLQSKNSKKYCFPSQEKILELLSRYHHVDVCRRTLNYWLDAIEKEGFFDRKRRIVPNKSGALRFHSTLYVLKGKAYKLIRKVGMWSGAKLARVFVKVNPVFNDRGDSSCRIYSMDRLKKPDIASG